MNSLKSFNGENSQNQNLIICNFYMFKKLKNLKRTSFGQISEAYEMTSYFRIFRKMKILVQAIQPMSHFIEELSDNRGFYRAKRENFSRYFIP